MAGPEILVPIALFFSVAFTIVGFPLARGWARKQDRQISETPRDITARLERMEQAIDSIAIEVERISEGQRFTTKLLSERGREEPRLPGGSPSSSPER